MTQQLVLFDDLDPVQLDDVAAVPVSEISLLLQEWRRARAVLDALATDLARVRKARSGARRRARRRMKG